MPWLYSAKADSLLILGPAFAVTLAVVVWSSCFSMPLTTSPMLWLLLVVGVDVAHVYSTLYRTYLDPAESRRYRSLLIGVPIACWTAGILLYSAGRMAFWHVLAYLAVFHFIRQQYGFLRLYARREKQSRAARTADAAAIYMATLYPLIYWHTHPRRFSWFLEGDFFHLPFPWIERVALVVYLAALAAYVIMNIRCRCANWPKHLLLAGTALSWYVGIVLYDGDLVFTATNVLAHGIPYMALVWFHERKKSWSGFFTPGMVPVYAGFLAAIAYLEEGFWDRLVWRDHPQFYHWLSFLPQVQDPAMLALLVPLLAVPQATHYVLDGFIWRLRGGYGSSPSMRSISSGGI